MHHQQADSNNCSLLDFGAIIVFSLIFVVEIRLLLILQTSIA